MIFKLKIKYLKILIYLTLQFFYGGSLMAGNNFSAEGNNLYKALVDHLIAKGLCSDYGSCWDKTNIYREDDTKIRINMYGQDDKKLSSIVAQFLIENGAGIAAGRSIILKSYGESKDKNLENMLGRKDWIFTLEIKK